MNKKEDLIKYWIDENIVSDKRIIDAFQKINRENFVPEEYKNLAYNDYPLSIGEEQTISQPTTVAIMTSLLEPKEDQKILEIGTGSGYQVAILGKIVGKGGKITSVEIIPKLAEFAKKNLKKENITNVEIINADGSSGYKKGAPYDRILVTAGTPKITETLISQLNDNGIIVAPVGFDIYSLTMTKIIKKGKKRVKEEHGIFSFVPLIGKEGFDSRWK
ncbi:MAG: protein-L-isoaspartate(D-aspartate) O-methyltransferase [Candidatus Aenigmarchaeota archaeon]|nr:protein-L-isoaspartate(D-aspartate) O-methyltransferase [Candidatus Aenigmarchaeota archaeon]